MRTAYSAALAGLILLATPASGEEGQSRQDQQTDLSNPLSAFGGTERRSNWQNQVVRTERGHKIGNPQAEAALIEFISYTCSHCAAFSRQGDGALDLALLAPGLMTVEIRPVIRNYVDLTVSLLVACGEPTKFKDRHRLFLSRQAEWLGKVQSAPQSQRSAWSRGNRHARTSMASSLGLDDMLAQRGVSRMQINTCLADDDAARALLEKDKADRAEFDINGTPTFALDGKKLDGVHDWSTLYPVLSERFRPVPAQN